MKARYGTLGHYVEVNCSLSRVTGDYNKLFGDPFWGFAKELTISHPDLTQPVTLAENTPFSYDPQPIGPLVDIGRLDQLTLADSAILTCSGQNQQALSVLSLFPSIDRVVDGDQWWIRKSALHHLDLTPTQYGGYNLTTGRLGVKVHLGLLKINPTATGMGLVNQLLNLANCLYLGQKTGRKIVDPKFMVQFDAMDSIPMTDLITNLDVIKHPGSFLSNPNHWTICPNRNSLWSQFGPFEHVIDYLNQQPFMFDIGCSFPVLPRDPQPFEIIRGFQYSPKVMEVVNYCKQVIGGPYTVVHLRLEDDWLGIMLGSPDPEQTGRLFWGQYLNQLRALPNLGRLFVATHLGKGKNHNDYILDELKAEFPRVVTSIPWRDKFQLPVGREIDALIDFLIAIDGKGLVGCKGSTFSEMVSRLIDGPSYLLGDVPTF